MSRLLERAQEAFEGNPPCNEQAQCVRSDAMTTLSSHSLRDRKSLLVSCGVGVCDIPFRLGNHR
jgi:hypothetical protein